MIVNKVKELPVGQGFDAYNEIFVDMIKAGILDPAKVQEVHYRTQQALLPHFLQQSLLLQTSKKRLRQCRQVQAEWAE